MNSVDFNQNINRMGTFCTQWDYIADRFGKSDILPFSISDMDFEVAPAIKKAVAKRVEHGVFGYSRWNHDEFKNAIVKWFDKRFNTTINPNFVAYSPSIIYSLAQLIEDYTSEGDGIIIHLPTYTDFCTITESQKRVVLKSQLTYDDEGRVAINFDELEELAKKAKMLIWCSPHNPTGRVWSLAETTKMMDIAKKYNLFVISDDAHMDIMNNSYKHTPIAKIWSDYANAAIITSTAKGFNTPSLGGSYAIFNNQTYRDNFINKQKLRGLGSPAILGVIATISAYNDCDDWINNLNNYITNNYLYVRDYFKDNFSQLSLAKQEGTYFAWINVSKLGLSGTEIQKKLVEIGKVGIMGGHTYFEKDGSYLRLNLAAPKSKIEDGLKRLTKSLK